MNEDFSNTESGDHISTIDGVTLVVAVWTKRKLISMVVICSTVVSIIISLLLQESFLSTAVLLPETDKSKLAGLGGLSDLASLAGVNVGGGEGSLVKLYPTIVKSEALLKTVVYKKYQTKEFEQPVNLIEYWEIEEKTPELAYEKALKLLTELLQISMDNKTLVFTLSISTPEPQLSAAIINTITEELDSFIRSKRTTSASNQRKFVEGRLTEIKLDLTSSENKLKEFREKNRQVFSPQLLLEQERLIRDLQINAAIYTELRKQFELVKIEEVKNIPVINILNPARPAAKKDKPKRTIIVITVFLLSLIGSIGYVIFQKQYGSQIEAKVRNLQISLR